MKEIEEYHLEKINDTLYSISKIFNSQNKQTCLDRDIIMCLNIIRKIINNEPITGKEKLENLYERNRK